MKPKNTSTGLPKWKYRLCRIILLLDRIPRYGRLYVIRSSALFNAQPKPIWRFMRRGLWGFYLLDRIGWLHEYIDAQISWSARPIGVKAYRIYKSRNWREDLKWRRRLGIWPKTINTNWRVSRTRRMHEASADQS